MSTFYVVFLAEQTILLPISFYLLKWDVVKKKHLPLFFYLISRWLFEFSANMEALFIKRGNAEPYNLLYLLEPFFITWQLCKLGAFGKNKKLYYTLQCTWAIVWLADTFWIGSFQRFNFFHHVFYSFILLFISAGLLSKLAVSVRQSITRSLPFWLCIVFCTSCMYNIMYEAIEFMSNRQPEMQSMTVNFSVFMEVVVAPTLYLIICWAIICVPGDRSIQFYAMASYESA